MPRSDDDSWMLYGRSFLATLGLLFIALICFVWHKQREQAPEWSTFAWVLFLGIGCLGMVLLCVALFASARSVERWAESASTHEASIVVMIVAAPVYFLCKCFMKKK
jgi:drug/metabolite transporter (DMT)-like permease